jgi:uncharacterized protein (DUF58 family)
VASGGRHGERLSKDLGSGIEFKDYRSYTPGDDLRAIDWNIYRRLGKVFLRLYEEQQDLPLYLMPDISSSMFHEAPPRARVALRTTLALATISLNHHDSAGLFPFAEQMDVRFKSKSGRTNTMTFAQHLARLAPPRDETPTNLAASVRRLVQMNLRRGLLVIISDFFDPGGIDAVRDALTGVRHRLLFVQLTRASDATPDLDGDVRVRDCETGEMSNVTITPSVLARYRAAYERFNEDLAALARSRQGGLLRIDVDADLVTQLYALFASGSWRV